MVDTGRRRQIEDVASEMFRDQGYAATGVRDIARALDIQGASLYAHVTSRRPCCGRSSSAPRSMFESAADRALEGTEGRPASARMRALVVSHVGVVTGGPEAASVFDREWRHLEGPRRDEIRTPPRRLRGPVPSLIEDGVEAGDFAPLDPSLSRPTFLLTALNAVGTWYRPDGRRSAAELADAYAELALRSLTEGGA